MTTRHKFKWSVFDLVTIQAAYNPETILDNHDMKKTIYTRSENVKILANNNGWPGAAEDALFDAFPNPLGFPKSAFPYPLGSPESVFPDPLGSPEEPAKNR